MNAILVEFAALFVVLVLQTTTSSADQGWQIATGKAWAYVKGSSSGNNAGNYEPYLGFNASAVPRGLIAATFVVDGQGTIWILEAGSGKAIIWKSDGSDFKLVYAAASTMNAGAFSGLDPHPSRMTVVTPNKMDTAHSIMIPRENSLPGFYLYGGYGYGSSNDAEGMFILSFVKNAAALRRPFADTPLTLCLRKNAGYLADLWMFDGTSWTLVSGSGSRDVCQQPSAAGSGVAGVGWLDSGQHKIAFGGYFFGTGCTLDYSNAMWSEFTTLVKTGATKYAVYGSLGVASLSNWPGGRYAAAAAVIGDGKVLVIGGFGYVAETTATAAGLLNVRP